MNNSVSWSGAIRHRIGPIRTKIRRRIAPRLFKETYINEELADREDSVYVEIGVRWGYSFRSVHAGRKIGIDPVRTPEMRVLRAGEEFFAMDSDRFFAEEAPRLFSNRKIDVALVDGLHEFGQALRDVLNLERFMVPNGLIVLDDCNPHSLERGSDVSNGGEWNGDVWKVAAFLQEQRPDLRYLTVDADEGIGLLANFVQSKPYPDAGTLSKYKELNYSYLEQHRAEVLNLVSPGVMSSVWDK